MKMLFLILLLFAGPVCAADIYVNPSTGVDAGNCQNIASPCLTIVYAGDPSRFTADVTMWLRGGTYAESIYPAVSGIAFGSGSSDAHRATVRNYPGEVATIQSLHSQNSGLRVLALENGVKYVTFRGDGPCTTNAAGVIADGGCSLVIDGVNMDYDTIQVQQGSGGTTDITFQYMEIKRSANQCLGVGVPNVHILNDNIHNCGSNNLQHGIYMGTGAGSTVWDTTIHDVASYGIHGYDMGSGGMVENFQRNTIWNWGINNGGFAACIYLQTGGTGHIVENNVCYKTANGPIGIKIMDSSSFAYNNTIVGADTDGIHIEGNNNTVRGNILFANATAVNDTGSGNTVNNNPTTDPTFVNAGIRDYRLASTSNAIAACPDLSATFTTDRLGFTRAAGMFDCGAYRFAPLANVIYNIFVPSRIH